MACFIKLTRIDIIKPEKQRSKAYVSEKKTLKYHINKVMKDHFDIIGLRLVVA